MRILGMYIWQSTNVWIIIGIYNSKIVYGVIYLDFYNRIQDLMKMIHIQLQLQLQLMTVRYCTAESWPVNTKLAG